jgi:hypothetical protein
MTTPTTTTDLTILKTDALGRIQTPAEQRETLLDAFEHSGMSGAAFAKLHGIDPYAYLKDVLERLPHMTNQQVHLLTPRSWAEEKSRAMKLAS